MKVDFINPNILRELSQRFPESAQRARKRLKNFDRWLAGEDFPTYNQLVQLSKIFDVPFGDFFLERLPKIPLPFEGGSKKNFRMWLCMPKRFKTGQGTYSLSLGMKACLLRASVKTGLMRSWWKNSKAFSMR
jgi:hypothetical protein